MTLGNKDIVISISVPANGTAIAHGSLVNIDFAHIVSISVIHSSVGGFTIQYAAQRYGSNVYLFAKSFYGGEVNDEVTVRVIYLVN